MKTKPFNLEEYLTDPSKKVVTKDRRQVRIICTDVKDKLYPIIALVYNPPYEDAVWYNEKGYVDEFNIEDDDTLFFLDESEEELTEFEKALVNILEVWGGCEDAQCDYDGIRLNANTLLNLARKQIYEEFKDFTKLPKEE